MRKTNKQKQKTRLQYSASKFEIKDPSIFGNKKTTDENNSQMSA